MKRLVSLLLIITVVLLFLFSGWFSVETRANEGYWKLDRVTVDKNEDSERTTMTVEQGYATYITKDENSGDVFAASGSWTPPDDEYRGGDTVTLTAGTPYAATIITDGEAANFATPSTWTSGARGPDLPVVYDLAFFRLAATDPSQLTGFGSTETTSPGGFAIYWAPSP